MVFSFSFFYPCPKSSTPLPIIFPFPFLRPLGVDLPYRFRPLWIFPNTRRPASAYPLAAPLFSLFYLVIAFMLKRLPPVLPSFPSLFDRTILGNFLSPNFSSRLTPPPAPPNEGDIRGFRRTSLSEVHQHHPHF